MAFWPKTLDESAEWLTGKGIKEATGRELLRLGAAGYIYIGLLLSCRGFSPTENFKNEDKLFDKKRVSDAPINEREWRNAHDRAYIDLAGFYIVPPKVLFELELNGEAKTEIVFKPEPEGLGDYFYVYKDVTFDELRMSIYHLEKLKTSIIKSDIHIVGDAGAGSQDDTEPKEQELTQWLRETWIKEGKQGGTAFFRKLKKYANQKGSPIIEHYSAGVGAGFKWKTSKGTSGEMKKSTLLNKVSIFKKIP